MGAVRGKQLNRRCLTTRADLDCFDCFDFFYFPIVGLPNRWMTDCFALCCSPVASRGAERTRLPT